MLALSLNMLSAVCPDSRAIPLPSTVLSNSCSGGGSLFSAEDLNGPADVMAVYNGDQT